VGLITGLLTLPLAPVRGTVWIAEQIHDQAVEELYGEEAIQAQLHRLEELHAAGEIDDEELVSAEDELLERLAAARGFGGEEGYG
jgi:Gas vesicle protein G